MAGEHALGVDGGRRYRHARGQHGLVGRFGADLGAQAGMHPGQHLECSGQLGLHGSQGRGVSVGAAHGKAALRLGQRDQGRRRLRVLDAQAFLG